VTLGAGEAGAMFEAAAGAKPLATMGGVQLLTDSRPL
jgi:hypothetical protein